MCIKTSIIAFYNEPGGFEQKQPEELRKIAFWLKVGMNLETGLADWKCLWDKILDVTPPDNYQEYLKEVLDMLNGMTESHTTKVVECFAKTIDVIDQRRCNLH